MICGGPLACWDEQVHAAMRPDLAVPGEKFALGKHAGSENSARYLPPPIGALPRPLARRRLAPRRLDAPESQSGVRASHGGDMAPCPSPLMNGAISANMKVLTNRSKPDLATSPEQKSYRGKRFSVHDAFAFSG